MYSNDKNNFILQSIKNFPNSPLILCCRQKSEKKILFICRVIILFLAHGVSKKKLVHHMQSFVWMEWWSACMDVWCMCVCVCVSACVWVHTVYMIPEPLQRQRLNTMVYLRKNVFLTTISAKSITLASIYEGERTKGTTYFK